MIHFQMNASYFFDFPIFIWGNWLNLMKLVNDLIQFKPMYVMLEF